MIVVLNMRMLNVFIKDNKDLLKLIAETLLEDETLTKYMDRIILYDGNILITDYKQEFNVSK